MGEYKIENVIDTFKSINSELSYEQICRFTDKQQAEYGTLLHECLYLNGVKKTDKEYTADIALRKGKALESLVEAIFTNLQHLFIMGKNIRTSTNEIDQVIKLSAAGKALCSSGIIDQRYKLFLGECKNYNKKVDATYIGKFSSLLVTCNVKLGILFSFYGLTGKSKWSDAQGFVRRFYMLKENTDEKYFIIDFNRDDFIALGKGEAFLTIIERKMDALILDTSYNALISSHPSENILQKYCHQE